MYAKEESPVNLTATSPHNFLSTWSFHTRRSTTPDEPRKLRNLKPG
jgi:hypothetical protein